MVSRKAAARKPRMKTGKEVGAAKRARAKLRRYDHTKHRDELKFPFVWTKVNENFWALHRRELWIFHHVARVQRCSDRPNRWHVVGTKALPIHHGLSMSLRKAKATAIADLVQCHKNMIEGLKHAKNAK